MSFIHPSNFDSFFDDKCSGVFNEIDLNLIENIDNEPVGL